MRYAKILEELAPCGLNCSTCVFNSNGKIKKLSSSLQKCFGFFDNYAKNFSNFQPVFANYPNFKKLLEFLSKVECDGCRSGKCNNPDCRVLRCHSKKDVDFCFQCEEFPCDNTKFDDDLKTRWIQMNKKMKEIGVKRYYQEIKEAPRYK
jgi:hypothetical protein